jgi:type IV pilus assembly protein PilB
MIQLYDNQRLYEVLTELGVVDKQLLDRAREKSLQTNSPLGEVLLEMGGIDDDHFGQIISDMVGVPLVKLKSLVIDDRLLRIVPEIVARKYKIVAFGKDEKGLKLAMVNPKDVEIASFIAKKVGEPVYPFLATERDIEQTLGLYKKDLQKSVAEMLADSVAEAGKGGEQEAPVTRIVEQLITYAYANRASDIHIEPEKTQSVVRFRIDGVLHDVLVLPKSIHAQVVSKVKISAKLRTDEKMAAQDGKMQFSLPEEELDIRVSVVPIVNGEKVVMRLLSSKSRLFTLTDLGMSDTDLEKVNRGFSRPFGMVLSTGPTGSGKTTTIYSILKIVNTRDVNIATIEDPVEYDIEGINQIQVNSKTNLTFADGLRAILRQDPNVIFVGEIRDEETAGIAVNSAMTGHLVLSTLHTNDAATTLPRLMDMGIEPYLVASTVNVIVGQRLVRKICEKCRFSQEIDVSQLTEHFTEKLVTQFFGNKKKIRVYLGKGCPVCHKSGYQGRIGIFEVMEMTEGLRELIMAKENSDNIEARAVKEGMTTMVEDGLTKIRQGLTTVDEVLRVTKN